MPQAGFDPPREKWQLCLNIVVSLPPRPPWLDILTPCYRKFLSTGTLLDLLKRNCWNQIHVQIDFVQNLTFKKIYVTDQSDRTSACLEFVLGLMWTRIRCGVLHSKD